MRRARTPFLLSILLLVAGLAPAWAADLLPKVTSASGTTTVNLQAGDRLAVPTASGGYVVAVDPGAQTASRVLAYPVLVGTDTLVVLGIPQTFGAKITLPAGTTGAAPLNLPQGSAPTSPVNGDIWTTTAGVFACINGTTVGPFSAGGGSGTVTSVGLTVPSFLSVANSPVTGSATLAVTYSGTPLPFANGGTNSTSASAAFAALWPGTALGDTVYATTAGAPAVLAGNTTTARKFWSQTGTGTASAAPAWVGPLSVGDLPTSLPGSIIGSGLVAPTVGGLGLDASTAANGKLLFGTGSGLTLALPSVGTGLTYTASSGGGTWGLAGSYTAVADAAYTMLAADRMVAYTSITASRIVTLPAASSVPPGQIREVLDSSGSVTQAITITISRAGSDTIEGGTISWTIRTPKGWRAFASDGVSNWRLIGMSTDVQFWIGAGTYTWNAEPGAKRGTAIMIGGGAGGAGGAQEPSGTVSVGGGGGSSGGYSTWDFSISDAGTSQTVIIGAGGTSGAGAASTGSAGSNSGAGGTSSFAAGVAGVQTIAGGALASVGGGAATGGTAGTPGQGTIAGYNGGTGNTSGTGGNPGNNNLFSAAAGSGGAGGGIPAAGTPFQLGGNGGSSSAYYPSPGGSGTQGNARGNSDGAAGGSPSSATPAGYPIGAPGAGGGASSIVGVGGAGGNGGRPGGGGGGGGAAPNGHAGGAGGTGGDGAGKVTQGL